MAKLSRGQYRLKGSTTWTDLFKDVDPAIAAEYSWTLPDKGEYELRVGNYDSATPSTVSWSSIRQFWIKSEPAKLTEDPTDTSVASTDVKVKKMPLNSKLVETGTTNEVIASDGTATLTAQTTNSTFDVDIVDTKGTLLARESVTKGKAYLYGLNAVARNIVMFINGRAYVFRRRRP